MRKSLFVGVITLLVILLVACSSEGKSTVSKSKKDEITVWSFTDEGEYAVKKFMEKYPDKKVNFQYIPGDQYQTKLRSALQTGVNVPDVFATENSYVRKFIDHPSIENLSAEPYKADEYVIQQYEYVQANETDSEGNIKALAYQGTPGGFYYRRDLAKEYLGTDDPEEVSELISSWDSLFEIGQQVYEKSEGKVHVLPNWNTINTVQSGNVTNSWIEGDKLIIVEERMKTLDLVTESIEKNSLAMLEDDSAGLYAAMQKGEVIFFPGATWYLNFVIKEQAPDTRELWGLAHGVGSFSSGGTFYSMYSKSENKDLAWEFMKFYTFDHDFLTELATEQSYFTSNREVNRELAPTLTDEFLAGQKYFEFFNEEGEKVHPVLRSELDGDIDTIFNKLMESFSKGNIKTKEGFLEKFKQDVKHDFPEIEVE